jgi:hypothetical protein
MDTYVAAVVCGLGFAPGLLAMGECKSEKDYKGERRKGRKRSREENVIMRKVAVKRAAHIIRKRST